MQIFSKDGGKVEDKKMWEATKGSLRATFIACGPRSGQVNIMTKIERLEMKYTFHDPKFFSVQTRFEVGESAKPATYNISVWQNRKIFRWLRITF